MTTLTLSAPSHPLRDEDAIVAARLQDLLELQSRARVRGCAQLSEYYADRIIAEVIGSEIPA